MTEQRELSPEEQLAALYAAKRGVSPDTALQILNSLSAKGEDRIERLKKYLEALKTGIDVFSILPPQVAQTITPMIMSDTGGNKTDVERLVTTATAIKSILGDSSQEFQYKLLEKLLDMVLQQPQQPQQQQDVIAGVDATQKE